MPDRPVFVVGNGRSGTTLLFHVLVVSSRFPEYHAESRILLCQFHYGSLRRASNRARFASDFLRSRQFARSGLSEQAFLQLLESSPDYVSLLSSFMEAIAESQGKTRWSEKTPGHVLYMDDLAAALPDARFVHIIRDGRDVALSVRRLGWTPRCGGNDTRKLLWAALSWRYMVEKGRSAGARLGPRYLELRYEDLVSSPGKAVERLSGFCDLDISLADVEAASIGSLGAANTAFEGKVSGLSQGPVQRWRSQSTAEEQAVLNAAVGPLLADLGYDEAGSPGAGGRPLTVAAYRARIETKQWLKRRAPLPRALTGSPLELGLT